MATPLYTALCRYIQLDRTSFHTPGHKGQAALLQGLMSLSLDLTELPETGSLYDGGDVIEAAEIEAAQSFGAKQTFFSGGGCTLCMHTMLGLAAARGRAVLMGRNAHRSAVHAAVLLDLDVRWQLSVDPASVEAALQSNPAIRTVYITSPDYYGRLADIKGLSAVCRRFGAALLVDNAHGSHLGAFGLHPLQLGADITADSAHKTLPVLTGGAYLHIAKDGVFADVPRARVKSVMGLFGSTSPAFPVLASLDVAQNWWNSEGASAFEQLRMRMVPLRDTAAAAGLTPAFECCDPVRLTLDCKDGDAAVLAARLRENGAQVEYADTRYAVLLLSPFHTEKQLLALQSAIEQAVKTPLPRAVPSPFSAAMPSTLPRAVMSLRKACFAPSVQVPVQEAAGRIAAQTVCPCPPGVAVIAPGEEIGAELAQQLQKAGFATIAVVG